MESQYILRLPDYLQNIQLSEAKLTVVNKSDVVFEYKGDIYQGIIVRPVSIIESHKLLDNKLYKIADIESIIVILGKNLTSEQIEQDRKMWMVSGITPPMKYAKLRRFRRQSERVKMVQEVEKKVLELLKKDDMALRVEIINPESQEVDEIAAEIENELKFSEEDPSTSDSNRNSDVMAELDELLEKELSNEKEEVENSMKLDRLESMRREIEEKELHIKNITNPILKKRYQHTLLSLKAEYEKLQRENDIE